MSEALEEVDPTILLRLEPWYAEVERAVDEELRNRLMRTMSERKMPVSAETSCRHVARQAYRLSCQRRSSKRVAIRAPISQILDAIVVERIRCFRARVADPAARDVAWNNTEGNDGSTGGTREHLAALCKHLVNQANGRLSARRLSHSDVLEAAMRAALFEVAAVDGGTAASYGHAWQSVHAHAVRLGDIVEITVGTGARTMRTAVSKMLLPVEPLIVLYKQTYPNETKKSYFDDEARMILYLKGQGWVELP